MSHAYQFRILLVALGISLIAPLNLVAQLNDEIGRLIEAEGDVKIVANDGSELDAVIGLAATSVDGVPIKLGNTVATGEYSTATVKTVDGGLHRLQEITSMQFGSRSEPEEKKLLSLFQGMVYFFSRQSGKEGDYKTDFVNAAIKGTEFVLWTDEFGTRIHMIEGEVELTNTTGAITVPSGFRSNVAANGTIEEPTPIVKFGSELEWFYYYPRILIVEDLDINPPNGSTLAESIDAYRIGDMKAATKLLQAYADSTDTTTPGEAIYLAALALSVGRVDETEAFIRREETLYPSEAAALRALIGVIQGDGYVIDAQMADSASLELARSYQTQSTGDLSAALDLTESASRLASSPNSIILARKSELLFSLGRYAEAQAAASDSLDLAPQNVVAKTRLGFLQSVAGDDASALNTFSEALAIDSGYPEAWLGSGLMRIRNDQIDQGVQNIETAIALSPSNASYRNYLSRLFMDQSEWQRAETESELAIELAPTDPNVLLVSALQYASQNETARAMERLRESIQNNDQRSVFRSPAILAEDDALRRANLAELFSDAGLPLFAIREATKAASKDPGSFTAHKFLAQAFASQEDPSASTLRFQSPAQAERLNFDILSPARFGLLPFSTTPNNYNNLLSLKEEVYEAHIRGLFNYGANTAFRWNKTFDKSSVALSGEWDYLEDLAPDWNFDRRTLEAGVKFDLTEKDTLTGIFRSNKRRDTNPSSSNDSYDEEFPSALIALRHQWSPEGETAVYVQSVSFDLSTRNEGSALVTNAGSDEILGILSGSIDSEAKSDAVQVEVQHRQIFETYQIIGGVRLQEGDWETQFQLEGSPDQNAEEPFDRAEAYLYGYFEMNETVTLIAGVNATRFTFPLNLFTLPSSPDQKTIEKFMPKLGVYWDVAPNTTFRAAYLQSLGGLALEDGYRLEPTQVAGFLQGYRTLLAEDIDGTHPALEFENAGIGLTHTTDSNLFFDVELNSRKSTSDRGLGHLKNLPLLTPASWSTFTEFEEQVAAFQIAKIVGKSTTLSVEYSYNDSEVDSVIPTLNTEAHRDGQLNSCGARILQRTSSGFFTSFDVVQHRQDLSESSYRNGSLIGESSQSGIDHVQGNLEAGWRSRSGSIRLAAGVKNLFDDNTDIDPLNWTLPLYPERVFYLDGSWTF